MGRRGSRGSRRFDAAFWAALLLGIAALAALALQIPGAEEKLTSALGGVFRPGVIASGHLGPLSVTLGDLGHADPDACEVHVLDVGQADCILVRQGAHAMLIDTGEPENGQMVVDYLKSLGVRRLDCLVLTHPHADHIGGAEEVLKSVRTEQVILSHAAQTTRLYERVLDTIEAQGIPVRQAKPGDSYALGDAVYTILSPDPGTEYDNVNDYSVALRLSYGGLSMVFTGDMGTGPEAEILARGLTVDADVLKAGHHGSASASSQAFLDAVSPAVVVVTCAADSEDRLPNERILERFRTTGAAIFRSDEDGLIVLRFKDGQISVGTER